MRVKADVDDTVNLGTKNPSFFVCGLVVVVVVVMVESCGCGSCEGKVLMD